MKTLSEIDTTSKRATRSAGFSWGIAEEVGKNMRLLELFGLAGIKNSAFASFRNKAFKLGDQFVPKWIEEKQFNHLIGYQVDF